MSETANKPEASDDDDEVERVALAMYNAALEASGTGAVIYRAQAKAAIAAMNKPTQVDEEKIILEIMRGMVGHGLNLINGHESAARDVFLRLKREGYISPPKPVTLGHVWEIAALRQAIEEAIPFIGYTAHVPHIIKKCEDALALSSPAQEPSDV